MVRYASGTRHLTLFRVAPAAVAVFALAAPAHALTISGTNVKTLPETTPVRADASTRDVIYYLDLHAGTADERFGVRLEPPRFATEGGADEGSSLDGPLQFTLYGPGTVGKLVTEPAFAPLCSSRDSAFHGYATGAATVDVSLPAGANTTLAVRYKTGRRAPWADTDYRLRYAFVPALVGSYEPTSPLFGPATSVADAGAPGMTQPVVVEAIGPGRKIGAHLLLQTSPKGTLGDDGGAPRTISVSSRVRVKGRLLPATRGQRVVLQWAKPGGKLRTAARATTGKGGRFSATLRPPGRGNYELWASYPNQPGKLAADTTSCPVRFKVK